MPLLRKDYRFGAYGDNLTRPIKLLALLLKSTKNQIPNPKRLLFPLGFGTCNLKIIEEILSC